ncbi:hypothetical protein EE082_27705 [Klebsiella pneumoniae]|nr:hypothetical protein [Klebsiella pneumoniae]
MHYHVEKDPKSTDLVETDPQANESSAAPDFTIDVFAPVTVHDAARLLGGKTPLEFAVFEWHYCVRVTFPDADLGQRWTRSDQITIDRIG